MFWAKRKDLIKNIFFGALGIALIFITLKFVREDVMKRIVGDLGLYGVLIYIAVKAVSRIVVPVSGTPLYIIAALAYGPVTGTLYSFVGDMIGGAISFQLSRHFGRAWVLKFLSDFDSKLLPSILETISTRRGVVMMHFFLIAFPDIINYVCGLGTIALGEFLLIHAPFVLASDLFVAYSSRFAYKFGNLGILLFIVLIIVLGIFGSFLMKRYSKKAGQ